MSLTDPDLFWQIFGSLIWKLFNILSLNVNIYYCLRNLEINKFKMVLKENLQNVFPLLFPHWMFPLKTFPPENVSCHETFPVTKLFQSRNVCCRETFPAAKRFLPQNASFTKKENGEIGKVRCNMTINQYFSVFMLL